MRFARARKHRRPRGTSELDGFLLRIDSVPQSFQERLEALATREKQGIRGHLLVIAGGVGVLCGVA